MAITNASNWQIYNDQVRSAYAESIAQVIQAFFTNTKGAVQVRDAAIPGDYLRRSFWTFPSGLVTRRITTGVGFDSAVTPVTLSQSEDVRVRLSRKLGPVTTTFDGLRKIGASPETFSQVVGNMLAQAVSQKMLKDAVMALVAALNRSPYVFDSSATATASRADLARTLALLGDRSSDVVCWVMHSKTYFDLVGKDLDTSTSVDTLVSNMALFGGSPGTLGKPVIVTDESELSIAGTPTKYVTLGLVPGSVEIEADTQLADVVMDTVSGLENLMVRLQGERDWFLGLRGFAWDMTNGGANPTDGALATATNWDAVATDMKDRAGVVLLSQ